MFINTCTHAHAHGTHRNVHHGTVVMGKKKSKPPKCPSKGEWLKILVQPSTEYHADVEKNKPIQWKDLRDLFSDNDKS